MIFGLGNGDSGAPGAQWSTDVGFRCPSTQEALGSAKGGHVTYHYEFELPPPGRTATAHASEWDFLFGWAANVQLAPAVQKVSEQMQAYWTNFATRGDPNGVGLPSWPKFTAKAQAYLAFTADGAAAKKDLRRPVCEVFLDSLPARGRK